ncbi:coiled-coil domain-containing protein 180-like [Tubulanus polymorphus]|uniref:coiled-coil domain-containing protein 180-like n=1 Tax=Tubulanus polymorphus TaxID=672921 RepID=UPI003DA27D9E
MAQAELPVRPVQSGKVYRQIFDAEVQLVNTLNEAQEKRKRKGGVKVVVPEGGIPIVHREPLNGLLNSRQKAWVESFPNDHFIENPVLIKQVTEFVKVQTREPESSVVGREVENLPDVVVPSKVGSDIIDRIAECRRERHESTVEDMNQELGLVSLELEPRIVDASEHLLSCLSESDREIERLLAQIEKDEDIIEFSQDQLHNLWSQIQEQSEIRQDWINELDKTTTQLEADRIQMIRSIFSSYSETLRHIAHLMAPDLQRYLDTESQAINQTVLSNKRAYADLYKRLMTADIDRERKQHTYWTSRFEDWKNLNTEAAIKQFTKYMESDLVTKPEKVESIMKLLIAEQETLNKKRIDFVETLLEMGPPTSTKSSVYKWNQSIVEVTKQIDQVNQEYLQKLYIEYEHVCQQCLEVVENTKDDLIRKGISTEKQANVVVTQHFLPQIGERQRIFEATLEKMDKSLENQNREVMQQLKSLFKFAQGSAHIWDVHEIGLAKQERNLLERLENCRKKHDNENQEREAVLDMMMDKLRQEANEQGLKDSLKRALDMLDKIKMGYEQFHQEQLHIVRGYPGMVANEIDKYDNATCRFFGVDRVEQRLKVNDLKQQTSDLSDTGEPTSPTPHSKKKKKKKVAEEDAIRGTPIPAAMAEILSTTGGTAFYVLNVAGEHGIPPESQKQLPPSKEEEADKEDGEVCENSETLPPYLQSITMSHDLFIDIKKRIRLNFLNHLDKWVDEAMDRGRLVVTAKSEELVSELELRMHLHQPRARRAEMDVHNVRAAELVMHSERVQRHCKGISQALNDLKQRFNDMSKDHDKLLLKFREDIENLETIFITATKSSRLVSLQHKLAEELENFMTTIRSSLRNFRQHIDDTLQMLRDSNARFIKSFKIFSDGGNFCPEEIEDYRKLLEKMSHKIDAMEGVIMTDLEGMESKRLEQATKVSHEFEDRFKHHMIDLVFMEKISSFLTNTQVRIKAEVAASNSMAKRLAQYIDQLETRIDACERPNLDKEQITPTELNDSLKEIFEAFMNRGLYLKSLKDQEMRPSSGTMQGAPAQGVRVGFSTDIAPISKAGKQPVEDPSIGVIKNILKTQKTSKLRFGLEAELDGMLQVPTNKSFERRKSLTSRASTTDVKSSARRSGTGSITSDTPSKRQAAGSRVRGGRAKIDKKWLVFGDWDDEDDESHFMGAIRSVVKKALEGMLTAAEAYYRQKSHRAVTRPQVLQETFDECATVIVQKLQSYNNQSDEYLNQCLQEFRVQLEKLERLIARVPALIVEEVVSIQIQKSKNAQQQRQKEFEIKSTDWETKKFEYKNLLRPTLGHPQQYADMLELCNLEGERHEDYLQGVEQYITQRHDCAEELASDFVRHLSGTSEQLLLQFDNLLTIDDVNKGRTEAKKFPTSELIRRKQAGLPLEDDESKTLIPRGKNKWPGIPQNEMTVVENSDQLKHTASVTTCKTTMGHNALITARKKCYEDYKSFFEKMLLDIENEKNLFLIEEKRWTDSWAESVDKVKKLY